MTRRGPAVVVATLATLLCAVTLAPAAVRPHPRIFLDRATLTLLRADAKARTPAFRDLRARCDTYLKGHVEWPAGEDYPEGSIGEGYQGDGYFSPLLELGLCFQTLRRLEPARARAYGAMGAQVLTKMSAIKGKHGADPIRDSGYGVRFFGSGMALGYDWLYPALSAKLRKRLAQAADTWVRTYERRGFGRDHPQGNYFAGYYAAKAYTGLAFERDSPIGARHLHEWLTDVHSKRVAPYYAANLSGGGWPEGWNYGWIGTLNMSLPTLAFKTAKGIDLVHRKSAPFAFPLAAARYQLHFTWPDLTTFEDDDALYDADNPTATQAWLYAVEATLLDRFGDPFAPVARDIAAAVRRTGGASPLGGDWDAWTSFLFGIRGRRQSYKGQPLSYRADGMDMVAMRSSWEPDAVWAALSGGPYVNNPDNGEEYFDKGSLAIVNGSKPFLVNAIGALLRNTPGTGDGSDYYNQIYDDNFGDARTHGLYNVFYVDRPTPTGQNNRLRSQGARTGVDAFSDSGGAVFVRDAHLEDMYPEQGEPTITSWTRELVYARPRLFFVFDRTEVTDASLDQRLAFHFPRAATAAAVGSSPGSERFDVGGLDYAGSASVVLPSEHRASVAGVLGGEKVVRLDIRPATPATTQRWLTAFDAAPSAEAAADVRPVSVASGPVAGALAMDSAGGAAAIFGTQGTIGADIVYDVPLANIKHCVADLEPGASYSVKASSGPGHTVRVTITRGATITADPAGLITFWTNADGSLSVNQSSRRTSG